GPDQHAHLAGADGQRAVLEHVEIAESLVQALDLDHRLGRRGDGGRGGAVGRRGGGRGGAVGLRGGGRAGAAGRRGVRLVRDGGLAHHSSTSGSGWCGVVRGRWAAGWGEARWPWAVGGGSVRQGRVVL